MRTESRPPEAPEVDGVAGAERPDPATVAEDAVSFEVAGLRTRHALRGRTVARAAVLAVAATIVLGVAAAQIVSPGSRAVHSSAQRAAAVSPAVPRISPPGVEDEPTDTPTPTQLPELLVTGDPRPTGRIAVSGDNGVRLLDLATGQLSAPISSAWADRIMPLMGGGYLCVCVDRETTVGTETMTVRAITLDGNGDQRRQFTIKKLVGSPDPAVSENDVDPVAISASLSTDGRTLYLSRVERRPPVWREAVDVVDVATAKVVQTLRLPDVPSNSLVEASMSASAGGARPSTPSNPAATQMVANPSGPPSDYPPASARTLTPSPASTPPTAFTIYAWLGPVGLSPEGTRAVIPSTTTTAGDPNSPSYWLADVSAGRLDHVRRLPTNPHGLSEWVCRDANVWLASPDSLAALCFGAPPAAESPVLRRVGLDGSRLGDDLDLGAIAPSSASVSQLVEARTGSLILWDPFSWTIARVDLVGGKVLALTTVPRPTSDVGPLGVLAGVARSLARAIAPSADAKMWLQPGLAVSPDGRQLYALAAAAACPGMCSGGSAGVFVFDTQTLRLVDRWAPTADFVSIGVSPDGRFVYAAGLPGVDSAGAQSDWPASVTIFDAATGDVREILGQLGEGFIQLDMSPVDH